MIRLVSIVERLTVARARDFAKQGIHVKSATDRGLLVKFGRGLYTRKDSAVDFERQVVLACKRVPRGIVCLTSALGWHGILPPDSRRIWMAIDR
jgi:hypothetical protein